MALNNQTKALLIVLAILLLIYLFYKKDETQSVENMSGEMGYNALPANMEEHESESSSSSSNAEQESKKSNRKCSNEAQEDAGEYLQQNDYAPPESDWLRSKFNGRNLAKRGFKRSSYSGAMRGNLGPSDWSDYFDYNNNLIMNSQGGGNANFLPIDETDGGFAVFRERGRATCGSNQNCQPEDLFDVDKYLPQEVNDDWFNVMPEPISVKNRHLINIAKPIGMNTIGTSLKNASWDIRGSPPCPKFVISAFNNSSIEPNADVRPPLM